MQISKYFVIFVSVNITSMKKATILSAIAAAILASCSAPLVEQHEGYNLVRQNGPTLGYSPTSGVTIILDGNLAFKDLNRNSILDPYEDWRLPVEERAANLASLLSPEEIAGLMLYSSHQAIPNLGGFAPATYNGKPFDESQVNPWELTDQQQKFLVEDNLRHVLITSVQSPAIAARWNNTAQALVEGLGHGIPNNNSSDPRNSADNDSEFNAGGGGSISMWPNELGMGATFDPQLMHRFGEIASAEYRALGFTTSLSPQIDIATDPRWMRFSGTYGEDPDLVTDMALAYCDAFQTSPKSSALNGSWGLQSVNAMAKHWPGGGAGESGRDAHFGRGKFAVYPNNNIALHKQSFIKGALNLKEGTSKAAAIMPYYTISVGQTNEEVANNFNHDMVTLQLREALGYDGVVCTDWMVTADELHPGIHSGKPWGIETLSVAQRHAKAILAGVDQFGGNDDKVPVLEAFRLIADSLGEEQMLARIRTSARRLLVNIFNVGLFENPYLDPNQSAAIVGNPDYMKAGYEAQLKSVVMLKNHASALPLADKSLKVFIPQRTIPSHVSFFGQRIPEQTVTPVKEQMASRYFTLVSSPEDADVALVFIDSPMSGYGFKTSESLTDPDLKASIIKAYNAQYGLNLPLDGNVADIFPEDDIFFQPKGTDIPCPDNGYYPISLQYTDYVALDARPVSIAGGDPSEVGLNRSYKGKGVRTINSGDMLLVQNMRKAMGDKKVIVVMNCSNPAVLSEIEPFCDALLVRFSISAQAVLDVISGAYNPSGLLPFQMPASMTAVEHQAEDTPRDMECYKDADNNTYDFAFGLNYQGVISDARTAKYKK